MPNPTLCTLYMMTDWHLCYPRYALYNPMVLFAGLDTVCRCHDPILDMTGWSTSLFEISFVEVQRRGHWRRNLCSYKYVSVKVFPDWYACTCTPAYIRIPYWLSWIYSTVLIRRCNHHYAVYFVVLIVSTIWRLCPNLPTVYPEFSIAVLICRFLSSLYVFLWHPYQPHVSSVILILHPSPS